MSVRMRAAALLSWSCNRDVNYILRGQLSPVTYYMQMAKLPSGLYLDIGAYTFDINCASGYRIFASTFFVCQLSQPRGHDEFTTVHISSAHEGLNERPCVN